MSEKAIKTINPEYAEIIRGVGRPRAFDSEEDLQAVIIDYFDHCIIRDEWPTFTGLANHIGITRKTLYNYGKDDEFFPTIKKARSIIEESFEKQLIHGNNVAGVIFNLVNNFGWINKTVVDNNNKHSGQVVLFEMPKNGKESDNQAAGGVSAEVSKQ